MAATCSNKDMVAPVGCGCWAGAGAGGCVGAGAGVGSGAFGSSSGLSAGMSRRERSFIEPVRAGGFGAGGAVWAGGGDAAGAGADEVDLAGLTSHALSSNPSAPSDFLSGTDADANGVLVPSAGFLTASSDFCSYALGSISLFVSTGGAGRPFLVLLRNVSPGPENKSPAPPSAPASPELRFYVASICYVTRRISPSLSPSVRSSAGVISGRFSSSI